MDQEVPRPPPALPNELITTILSSLLPPLPHLIDPSLLSPTLLQRLQYLPPSSADIDAFLSPFPSAPGQPISTALSQLERDGHVQGPVQYTHDGEVYMARVVLSPHGPAPQHETDSSKAGVEVWFSYEAPPPPLSFSAAGSTAPSRAWLYHSTRLPVASSASASTALLSSELQFYPSPRLVPLNVVLDSPPALDNDQFGASSSTQAPDNYWKGFTPPTPSIRLPDEPLQGEGGDDAYWAQYSRGPSTQPSRRTSYNSTTGVGAGAAGGTSGGIGAAQGSAYERPVGERRISAGFPMLDTKLNGLKMSRAGAGGGPDDATPVATRPAQGLPASAAAPAAEAQSAGERLLRQKIEATVSSILKRAWTEHSRSAAETGAEQGQEEAYELAGMEWLQLGRQVVDAADIHKSTLPNGTSSNASEGTRARIEVCCEMWSVLHSQTAQGGEGFWRLLEDSIRMPRGGFGGHREEQGWEQS